MSRILYISSEAFPLVKTGGLGDVAGSLPAALLKQSHDVRLLLPAYPAVLKNVTHTRCIATTSYYHLPVRLLETRLPGTRVTTWLVDCPFLYDRPGGPYADEHGQPWQDNAQRFAVLSHLAVDIALQKLDLNWQPEVVHCNDWQTGLVPALLSLHEKRPVTVFTIHNLAYQGIFDQQTFSDLHLPGQLWHMAGIEFYGQMSFIKGGLAYADKITAVSPSYAREILEPEYSYGLDGLLKHRAADLVGILNGIDQKHWNPGTDTLIEYKYNRRSVSNKVKNKTELQAQLGLNVSEQIPMLGMVSRLVEQKGLDIILQAMPSLLTLPLQVVILGTGEAHYQAQLQRRASTHPDRLSVTIGYNETLAHRIEAAADLYLMPSTFEPCGLNQLYSLRYGTLPVVTAVGGLADTVIDASQENIDAGEANGFVLADKTSEALISTIKHALSLYQDKQNWRKIQLNAMSSDHSWESSARHYSELYQAALAVHRKKS